MLDFTLHGWDLVDGARPRRPHLVGHSMGGMIAAEMAAWPRAISTSSCWSAAAGLWIDAHPIPDIFALLPGQLVELLFQDPAQRPGAAHRRRSTSRTWRRSRTFYLGQQRRLAMAGKILFPIPNRRVSKRLYRVTAPDPRALGRGRPADRAGLRRSAGAGSSPAPPCRSFATPATCCPTSSRRPSSTRSPAFSDERAPGRRLDRPAAQAARGPSAPHRRRAPTWTTCARPGCLHVALLRSPHAHARIARLDVEAARRAPRRPRWW